MYNKEGTIKSLKKQSLEKIYRNRLLLSVQKEQCKKFQ